MKTQILSILFLAIVSTQSLFSECHNLIPEPAISHIVLVIDRSGTMAGQPLSDAKSGARAFVSKMQSHDRVSILAFESSVEFILGETSNRQSLNSAIDRIEARGGTALYDAIVKAALSLRGKSGAKVVLFMTDGMDNASNHTIQELKKIGVAEGVFLYGIGLGDVDLNSLRNLSQATNATFRHTQNSAELSNIYTELFAEYKRGYGDRLSNYGSLTINSLPDGRAVIVNGKNVGQTPHRLDSITQGNYKIGVIYDRGIWECNAEVKPGYRTLVDSRESEIGGDLIVLSRPQAATTFLDGTYVGVTAFGKPLSPRQKDWVDRAKKDSRQLRIRQVPSGNHALRLRLIPDFDFGKDQEVTINLPFHSENLILFVDIFRRRAVDQNGKVYLATKAYDPFEELEGQFDEDF